MTDSAEPVSTTEAGAPAGEVDPLVARMDSWFNGRKAYWSDEYKALRRHRRLAKSGGVDAADDDEPGGRLVRVNIIQAQIRALVPHIYSKNPEISVSPSEAASDERYPAAKAFAATLQSVLKREFVKQTKLKKRAKRAVRAVLTSRLAWAKLSYQRDFAEDPEIRNRLADVQDQIKHIDKLRRDLSDPDLLADEESKRAELMAAIKPLEDGLETVVSEGLVLDILGGEQVVLDSTVENIDEYEAARRIGQEFYSPVEVAEEDFDTKLDKATKYYIGPNGDAVARDPGAGGDVKTTTPMICGREIWDRPSATVYTVARGLPEWLKEPWSPERQGAQWFPFFPLSFNPVDGYFWPQDLPEMIEELADEYNTNRTQSSEHREISVPHWIADKQTGSDSVERHSVAGLGEVVIVDAQGRPLNTVIEVAQPPPYNPAIYDTTPIRADIDMVSGLQDANRGGLVKPKTATEAEILQSGFTGRTDEKQDEIEEWIGDMARYASEVLLQELTPEQVQRIAGQGASWPQLSKHELFDLVDVEIRAGSSGRPDQARERQQWGEILPVIEGLVEKAEQRLLQQLDPRPTIELLRMTLRRFDERIDLEQLLPASLARFAVGSGGQFQAGRQPGGLPPQSIGGVQVPPLAPGAQVTAQAPDLSAIGQ